MATCWRQPTRSFTWASCARMDGSSEDCASPSTVAALALTRSFAIGSTTEAFAWTRHAGNLGVGLRSVASGTLDARLMAPLQHSGAGHRVFGLGDFAGALERNAHGRETK